MWRCEHCGAVFDEPDIAIGCYEEDYGLSTRYERHTYHYDVCPECGSEDIDTMPDDEEEE